MKFRTALCVAGLALSTLACGGSTTTSSDLSSYSVALTEPWSSMSLPVDGGSVLYSDATAVTITYTSGSVADIAGKYESAIKGGGWSETFKSTDNNTTTVMYGKDGGSVTLVVMESLGAPMVSLTKI